MPGWFGLISLVLLPISWSFAPAAPRDDTAALLEEFAKLPSHSIPHASDSEKSPARLAYASALAGKTPAETAAKLKEELSVSEQAAEVLLRAVLLDGLASAKRHGRDRQTPDEARLIAIEEDYLRAAGSAPGSREVLRALHDFYGRWRDRKRFQDSARKLAGLVATSPDPGAQAMSLLVEHPDDALLRLLLPIAARHYPEHPAVLGVMLNRLAYGLYGAPLADLALRRLEKLSPAPDPRVAVHMGQQQLRSLFECGLTAEAVTAFRRLPAATARRMLQGESDHFRVEIGGLPYQGYLGDLRLDLAAAHLLEGETVRAREILEIVEKAPPLSRGFEKGLASQRAILKSLLSPPRDGDPFDEIAEALANEAAYPVVWSRVLALFAERAAYFELAAWSVGEARDRVEQMADLPSQDLFPLPEEAARKAVRLPLEGERLAGRLAAQGADLRKSLREPVGTDVMGRKIARLLDQHPTTAYRELRLPAGFEPVEAPPEEANQRLENRRRELSLPAGFWPVRAERSGDEIVAIGHSHLEPPGGPPGYWVVRSRDGGQSWDKPLYTGLRTYSPYVVRSFSNLPLFAGASLQIEVDIRASTSPGGQILVIEREESGLYLDFPVAALERDSDGDGLTDLFEEGVLTDPRDSDTDGDGFGDAEDPLPNVPYDMTLTEERRVATAVVLHLLRRRFEQRYLPGKPPLPPRDLAGLPTYIFLGDRPLFASLQAPNRILVLTQEEMKQARKRNTVFSTHSISFPLLNREKTKALVRWSGFNEWGAFRLEKREGDWRLEEVAYTIALGEVRKGRRPTI